MSVGTDSGFFNTVRQRSLACRETAALGCELNVTRALVVHSESEQNAAESSLHTVLSGQQRTCREGSGCKA